MDTAVLDARARSVPAILMAAELAADLLAVDFVIGAQNAAAGTMFVPACSIGQPDVHVPIVWKPVIAVLKCAAHFAFKAGLDVASAGDRFNVRRARGCFALLDAINEALRTRTGCEPLAFECQVISLHRAVAAVFNAGVRDGAVPALFPLDLDAFVHGTARADAASVRNGPAAPAPAGKLRERALQAAAGRFPGIGCVTMPFGSKRPGGRQAGHSGCRENKAGGKQGHSAPPGGTACWVRAGLEREQIRKQGLQAGHLLHPPVGPRSPHCREFLMAINKKLVSVSGRSGVRPGGVIFSSGLA